MYFFKAKAEVFNHFHELKALVQNVTVKRIKVLHMDNRGECIESDFLGFYVKEATKREWKCPYNP